MVSDITTFDETQNIMKFWGRISEMGGAFTGFSLNLTEIVFKVFYYVPFNQKKLSLGQFKDIGKIVRTLIII